jgi:hypothetical protein
MATETPPFEKLDVDNYAVWSFRMKMLLMNKGCWDAIEKPKEAAKEIKNKAMSIMASYVLDHHLPTFISAGDEPVLAWEALETVYKAKSLARQLQLRRDLTFLKKLNSERLTVYISRARSIWTELITSGSPMEEHEVALCVLAGLPRGYDVAAQVLEQTTNSGKLTLDVIMKHMLPVEERTVRPETEQAFSARISGNPHANKECFFCGKKGHIKKDCRKRLLVIQGQNQPQKAIVLSALTEPRTAMLL